MHQFFVLFLKVAHPPEMAKFPPGGGGIPPRLGTIGLGQTKVKHPLHVFLFILKTEHDNPMIPITDGKQVMNDS